MSGDIQKNSTNLFIGLNRLEEVLCIKLFFVRPVPFLFEWNNSDNKYSFKLQTMAYYESNWKRPRI